MKENTMVHEEESVFEVPALQWSSCLTIPEIKEFRTREYFSTDEYRINSADMTSEPKSPWIKFLSTKFRRRFGGFPKQNIPELVERNLPKRVLNGYAVTRSISDTNAIVALGGVEQVAVPLYAVYASMEWQKEGQGGVLPVHGCGSFFLCKDAMRVFCWVFARYKSCVTIEDENEREKYRGWYVSTMDIGERIHLYDTEAGRGHFLFAGASV